MNELLANPAVISAAVSFFAFFAGFAVGRRRGKSEGFAEGERYAPLEMRRQAWERGRCLLCGSRPEGGEAVPDDAGCSAERP